MRFSLVVLVSLTGCDKLFGLESVTPIDSVIDDSGLVAYYPMDELSGGFSDCARDATPHMNDGACVPSMPQLVPGKRGMAYAFDGSMSVRVQHAAHLDTTAGLTVAGWIQLDAPPSDVECPFSRVLGPTDANAWQICIKPTGMFFNVLDGLVESFSPLRIGDWHHIAVTWSPTAMKGWLDGVLIGSAPTNIRFDDQPMVIGMDLDNGAPIAQFHGLIDDLRIYNRELTSSELHVLASN